MAIKCQECGQSFISISKRNEHLRNAHLKCLECNKTFNSNDLLTQHYSRFHNRQLSSIDHNKKIHKCEHCDKVFLHLRSKQAHIKRHHLMSQLAIRCHICRQDFENITALQNHKINHHNKKTLFTQVQSALRNNCSVYLMTLPYEGSNATKTIDGFFNLYYKDVYDQMINQLNLRRHYKVWLILYADIYKTNENNVISEYDTFFFRTGRTHNIINGEHDISRYLNVSKEILRSRFEAILTKGSGWSMHSITSCSLEIAKAMPLNGSCITDKISISHLKELKTINFIWEDNRKYQNGCLFYCIAAYFTSSNEMHILNDFIDKKMNVSNIETPVSLSHIHQVEEQNKELDFKINVLELQVDEEHHRFNRKKVIPIRAHQYKSAQHIINVLWVRFYSEVLVNQFLDREDTYDNECDELVFESTNVAADNIDDDEGDQISSVYCDKFLQLYGKRGHFMLIKNMQTFLRYHRKKYICTNCLTQFQSLSKFKLHETICYTFKPIVMEMPKKGDTLKFTNFNKKFKLPFVIFYDFEAILQPVTNAVKCMNCLNRNDLICNHKTKVINKQVPSCYSLLLLDEYENVLDRSVYTGEDCVEHFLEKLFFIRNKIFNLLLDKEEMVMSQNDRLHFENTNTCHICEKPILKNDKLGHKTADHSHTKKSYLGPAHNLCNLKRREKFCIPVIAHNSNAYDQHFILSKLHKIANPGSISAIPNNSESFRTFSVWGLNFLDSMAYLPSSLAQLAKDLSLTPNIQYNILDQLNLYKQGDHDRKELLLRKGVYPYEYVTHFGVYNEKSLPEKEKFNSTLSNSSISDEDYQHALKVYKMFNCETFKSYTELYCILDVAILSQVVMQFRDIIYNDVNLDLLQYISLPQMSMDAMLKTSKNELELLTDETMHMLVEQNIRGGVVFCNDRYKENDLHDSTQDLIYVDVNSLYATSMTYPLPYSNYKWCSLDELSRIDWKNIDTEGTTGYILQVDLICPPEIHDFLSEYPVAPENVTIRYEQLSPYAKHCLHELRDKRDYKARKLIASVGDKKEYLTHFANLKFYLSLGLKLGKIHCGFSFIQKKCFSDYINYCMEKRRSSVSKFSNMTYKYLGNSLYGKMIERMRDRLQCKFTTHPSFCSKFISDSNAMSFKILNDNLVCVFSKQRHVYMNRPLAIGFVTLEISKRLMYELFYKQLKPRFALLKCLYTDTDSLVVWCKKLKKDYNRDVFEIIQDLMDFSNFPKNHKLYTTQFKNALGRIKSELGCNKMIRIVALRSKTYAIEVENQNMIRRAKGVSYSYQNNIPFQAYLDCLVNINQYSIDQYQIRSYNHNLVTQKMTKITFDSFEDKRFLFNCSIHSLPYNHYRLNMDYTVCPICNISII